MEYEDDPFYPVQNWLKNYDNFLTDLRKYWSVMVLKVFPITSDCDCLNISFDDELIYNKLLLKLEQFITESIDPKKVFHVLQEADAKPRLCCKVFKSNEPTYSCRDCRVDSSCVLCVDCFKASPHINHKYRMGMSQGAGCCDCGDVEAWKFSPFCKNHEQNFEEMKAAASNSLGKLSPGVAERCELVLSAVLQYCYEVLDSDCKLRLPEGLEPENPFGEFDPDEYCTVMFNDEIHTYNQVIKALTGSIGCSHREAADFASKIDYEGRSIVRCASFESCMHVMSMVEKISLRNGVKSLICSVYQTYIISHQMFAIKLLSWVKNLLSYCEEFRSIFAKVMKKPLQSSELSLLEWVMMKDIRLWKTARNQWHQLFISGLLMSQESKIDFAKTFTRVYSSLVKDFINDDHEYIISITSLSTQIFTVPSLTKLLIEEDDAFFILIKTFSNECLRHLNHENKLAFERNQPAANTFRRAQYVLHDLKNLLSARPKEWTDKLRQGFLHGFKTLVQLLVCIQGMDSVVRQVGQHVEFEAEWETGINLQLKLSPVLRLVVEWCGSDRILLIKSLKFALQTLYEETEKMRMIEVSMGGVECNCIHFNVSSAPVTIHLPLSRLISGLLLRLTVYDVNYISPEFMVGKTHTLEEIMELPLRTLVMVAQYRAGMWRRNGYSLANQVFFYHNVKLREEMFDRDIIMLQYVAALIDPNEFLIHLANRFNIVGWASESFETPSLRKDKETLRQIVTHVEEYLGLILILVSERYTPGVGKVTYEERMKREIIHWLCMEPMTHSELLRCLPKDFLDDNVIEDLISEVARFKRPGGNQAGGKYELKENYYSHLNPFFYHYTRQEESAVQEAQIKRMKARKERLICCPPPVPPDFAPKFLPVRNIMNCKVFYHIVSLILDRALSSTSFSFSETQFEKLLHLIGVALHEENNSLKSNDRPYDFTTQAVLKGILQKLENCTKCERIDSHRDLLIWTITKFNEVLKLRGDTIMEKDVEKNGNHTKSKQRSAMIAAQRNEKILSQMKMAQRMFIERNSEYFKEDVSNEDNNIGEMEIEEADPSPIAVGPKQRGKVFKRESHICILCREEQPLNFSGCMVLAVFIQRSTVLSQNRNRNINEPSSLLMPSDLHWGIHISTCGHVMHADCWQKFYDLVLARQRTQYIRRVGFDVDKKEFLCPLCECLSNSVIPLIPTEFYQKMQSGINVTTEISLSDWLCAQHHLVKSFNYHIWKAEDFDRISEKLMMQAVSLPLLRDILSNESFCKFLDIADSNRVKLPVSSLERNKTKEMMKLFSNSVYTVGHNCCDNLEFDRVPIFSFWACAYTIIVSERLLRNEGKPIFGDLCSRRYKCLQALVKYIGVSSLNFDLFDLRRHCITIFRYLLIFDDCSSPCCLDVDAFGLLVSLTLTSPALYTSHLIDELIIHVGNIFDRHIINLLIVFHIVQIILTNNIPAPQENADSNCTESDSELEFIHEFYTGILIAAGVTLFQDDSPKCSSPSIKSYKKEEAIALSCLLKSCLLPFLRCTALFFHLLTRTAPPPQLVCNDDDNFTFDLDYEKEFNILCEYLGLPTKFSLLIGAQSIRHLARTWSQHPRVSLLLSKQFNDLLCEVPLKLIRQPHIANKLVNLPKNYIDLMNLVSSFPCPKSISNNSRVPTMCLVCGVILCSNCTCCRYEVENMREEYTEGACTNHSYKCGAGVGIFLSIRDCKVLLLAGRSKGCFLPPPYIDEYGETDQGLIRGNPLFLCETSYQGLYRLWLRHGIPEQITHSLELFTSLSTNIWRLY